MHDKQNRDGSGVTHEAHETGEAATVAGSPGSAVPSAAGFGDPFTVGRYRKRPVEVDAVQFDGENWDTVRAVCDDPCWFRPAGPGEFDDPEIVAQVWDHLHASWIGLPRWAWVVRGPQRENYPIVGHVFPASYEPVTAGPAAPVDSAPVDSAPVDSAPVDSAESASTREGWRR